MDSKTVSKYNKRKTAMDSRDNATLARIEERLKSIEEGKLRGIEADIKDLKDEGRINFATKAQVNLQDEKYKNIEIRVEKVEGGIGKVVWLIVSTVILAVLYLVVNMGR